MKGKSRIKLDHTKKGGSRNSHPFSIYIEATRSERAAPVQKLPFHFDLAWPGFFSLGNSDRQYAIFQAGGYLLRISEGR